MTDAELSLIEGLREDIRSGFEGVNSRINDISKDYGERLVGAETHVLRLVGVTGDNGRVGKIEGRLDDHEAIINKGKGAKWVVGGIILLGLDLLGHAGEWLHKK